MAATETPVKQGEETSIKAASERCLAGSVAPNEVVDGAEKRSAWDTGAEFLDTAERERLLLREVFDPHQVEGPLVWIAVVRTLVLGLAVPREEVDVGGSHWSGNPSSFPGPVSLSASDVEGRGGARAALPKLQVPRLKSCGMLDFKLRPARVFEVPWRPVVSCPPGQLPRRAEHGRDQTFDVVGAVDVVHHATVVPLMYGLQGLVLVEGCHG